MTDPFLSLSLIATVMLALAILSLLAHYTSPRFGFAPLVTLIGGLTVILQYQVGAYVQPLRNVFIFLDATITLPVLVMIILVIYISNGSGAARMTIFGVLALSVLTALILTVYQVVLRLPGTGGSLPFSFDTINLFKPRVTFASMIALSVNLFMIAVIYQGFHKVFPRLPEAFITGASLMIVLWIDAILFHLIADFGNLNFLVVLPGDILGKTFSGLVLWLPVGLYLQFVAPHLPGHQGPQGRKLLEVFFFQRDQYRLELSRVSAALRASQIRLRQDEEYYRQITDNVEEALWLFDLKANRLTYINPAYERIWGVLAAEAYASSGFFSNSLHPEDRVRVLAAAQDRHRGDYDVEYRIVRPDQQVRWIRERAFPIYDDMGQVYRVTGIAEDITQSKALQQHEAELAIQREKVDLLHNFISEAAHDLRSPLTSINLKIYALNKTTDETLRSKYLDDLQRLTERTNMLIDDLFTLSRLEAASSLSFTVTDLKAMLQKLCDDLQGKFERKQITLDLQLTELPMKTPADERDLTRALENLINNAINYTEPGGKVQVSATPNGQHVIRISDTGIGIPEPEIPKVFDRLYRGSNARSADPNGSGLGLSIVQRVITLHQGKIEVESRLNEGTTFIIQLPKAK